MRVVYSVPSRVSVRIFPKRMGGCCAEEELDFGALEEERTVTEEELDFAEEELVAADEEETAVTEELDGTSQGSDQQK